MTSRIKLDYKAELKYTSGTIAISGGGIGTYVTTVDIDISKSGWTPIFVALAGVGHPGSYNANLVQGAPNGTAKIAIFRTKASTEYTIPNQDIGVYVLYKRSA